MMRRYLLALVVGAAAFGIVTYAFGSAMFVPSRAISVTGQVNIGPLCPVEPCGRTFNYSSIEVVFSSPDGTYRTVPAASSGDYTIMVPAGVYSVTVYPCQWVGCDQMLVLATIRSGSPNVVNITIDTGIR